MFNCSCCNPIPYVVSSRRRTVSAFCRKLTLLVVYSRQWITDEDRTSKMHIFWELLFMIDAINNKKKSFVDALRHVL